MQGPNEPSIDAESVIIRKKKTNNRLNLGNTECTDGSADFHSLESSQTDLK
jgi:hypothetical protein